MPLPSPARMPVPPWTQWARCIDGVSFVPSCLRASVVQPERAAGVLQPRRVEGVGEVDAALDLAGAGPAAGAGVFAGADGPGAAQGVAADRGVALLVERVVRQVVLLHVLVDLAAGPVQQRGDGVAVVALGPLDELAGLASVGLVPADAAEPGAGREVAHRPLHRLVLVGGAAGLDV